MALERVHWERLLQKYHQTKFMVVKGAKMARETILIIEDDSDLREGLHFSFAGDGYDVLDAGTKRQGL